MIKKNLKNKKIIWSVLFMSTIVAAVPLILIPVFIKKNKETKKQNLNRLEILAFNIINANKNEIVEKTQFFYGLDYVKDIEKIKNEKLKTKYASANNLAKYIIENKSTYNIKIIINKEKVTNLDQILFVFKNKKDDKTIDNFSLINTFFKNKIIKTKFSLLTSQNVKEKLNKYLFRTIFYDKIELFFNFKNSKPTRNDFNFNIETDDEETIIETIKNYLLGLKKTESKITISDLKRKNNLYIKFKKLESPSKFGQITFKFEDYKEVKEIEKN